MKSLTGVLHSIAIDTTNAKIYLTTASSKIQCLSVDGSNFQPNLITGLESPQNINVAFGKVYWTERTNQIRRANLNGSGVETIVTTSGTLRGIFVQDSRLYWTEQINENRGKIQQAYLNGTNVKTVAVLSDVPIDIGMDAMHYDSNGHNILLYWTTASGKIQRADRDGKGKRNVATGLTALSSFALSRNIPRPVVPEFLRPALYWINRNNGTLYQLTGASVKSFLPSVRNATSFKVDLTRSKVYWTERTSNNTGKVRHANLDGTNIEDVKSLTGIPYDISIDTTGEKIYLTNSQGKIQRINFDGSNFQSDLITGLKSPKDIALDVVGGKLYWTENTGSIRQANLDGSNIRTFANNSGTIGDIVVGGGKLYWTLSVSKYDNYIMRSSLKNKKVERLGGSFIRPLVGIAVDTADNRIYWTDVLGQIRRGYLPGLIGKMLQPYIPLEGKNIITGLNAPGSLALGGDVANTPMPEYQHPAMYWTDNANGTLHHFAGNEVENLLPSIQNTTSLAVDITSGKIYWTEKTSDRTGKIQWADLDGTNVHLVKNLTSVPYDIAVDTANGKLYLTNSWGKVQRLNFDGSNFQTDLITGLDTPKHLALDVTGGKVYWTERAGKIRRADFDGTDIETLVTNLGTLKGIALANSKVYWTEKVDENSGKIQRANLDGTESEVLTTLEGVPFDIAVDTAGHKLYWTNSRGEVQRANFTGENVQNIATELGQPANLALGIVLTDTMIAAAPVTFEESPDETHLLTNYPNPFNPETWIPYQLATPSDVTLHIYAVNGAVVRTLALGHQLAGIYHSKSQAAYWDGRNEQGERVASGVYFYTLSMEDFTATRKMLIKK